MKRIIYFAIAIISTICLYSCDNFSHTEYDIPLYDQVYVSNYDEFGGHTSIIESAAKLNLPAGISEINKFVFEGHDYIRFRFSVTTNANGGVVHSPECRKCKNCE